ncbi:MAG: RnfH family protein [Burkholderiales bacterium]|nr:RnfH family protein [Burkholderiales bacterium]
MRTVRLGMPATVRAALEASGLLAAHPEIDLARNRVGIWNRLATLDAAVADGDRVEVYRPLQADPQAARRARVGAPRKGGNKRRRHTEGSGSG